MQQDPVVRRLLEYRARHVAPVAEAVRSEVLPESSYTARPMVLLLGNHSSGKSSLINHLLGQRVQRTGVAPTDDGFTVLMHGEDHATLDGATLTTDPKLPLDELARFGHGLVQHLAGRRLPNELLRYVWLIDSPGMIDGGASQAQRPYDFAAVVRWFAQRADLILLFFDPEKPGTTGETLTTLTESLAGVDDKLRIVMNKMDLFDGLRDFARTYGSLCWNLARALPTKDLPHIYTTVIPELVRSEPALPLEGFAAALLELERYITDLPLRRPDKIISIFLEECRLVLMRAQVVEALHRRVGRWRFRSAAAALLAGLGLAGAGWLHWHMDGSWWGLGWFGGAITVTIAGLWLAGRIGGWVESYEVSRLDRLFETVYRAQLAIHEQATDLHHRWAQVRPVLHRVLTRLGLASLRRVSGRRLRALDRLIEVELPALRV